MWITILVRREWLMSSHLDLGSLLITIWEQSDKTETEEVNSCLSKWLMRTWRSEAIPVNQIRLNLNVIAEPLDQTWSDTWKIFGVGQKLEFFFNVCYASYNRHWAVKYWAVEIHWLYPNLRADCCSICPRLSARKYANMHMHLHTVHQLRGDLSMQLFPFR